MDPSKPPVPPTDADNDTKLNTTENASPTTESSAPAPSGDTMPDAPSTSMGGESADMPPTPSDAPEAPGLVPPADPMAPAPKSKKKGLLMGLIAGAAVLVLGGGAAAAYFGYVVPNKPENILKTSLANMLNGDMKSYYFDGSVDVTEKSSDQTITATLTGKANDQGAMELNVNVDAVITKITFDVRSVDGSAIYVRMGGLDGLPELLSSTGDAQAESYAPIIATLNNQWFEINKSILSQLGIDLNSKASEAEMQKMAQLYEQHQFLAVKQKLADETIKGMSSYHMQVVVDKDQLKQYLQGMIDAKLESLAKSKDALDSLKKSLADSKTDFSKYPIDLWIAKDKKLIDQVKFSFSDDEASATLRVTMFDFGKSVSVEKPTGTKSILDVIGTFLEGTGGDTTLLDQLESGISL